MSSGSQCGLGVMVASDAAGDRCFSLADNVDPYTADTSVKPSVDAYKNPACYVDSSSSRLLTGGSTTDTGGMTVEKCVAAAVDDAWWYIGVEAGG